MPTGYADLFSWWVRGATQPDGTPAKDHEMRHVAIHRDAFNGFVASASMFTGQCACEAKARCLASVITGDLRKAWVASNHVANLKFDCESVNERCSEVPGAE